jgi:hypothetical protein
VHAHTLVDRVPSRLRAIGGIGVLTISMLAGNAGVVHASSVTPTPVDSGNPTCGDFDPSWTELKVDGGLGDGTFSDGTLTVTISNFQNSNSPAPGSFDWSSNIGVDAVFVKAGNDKHNLFVYDPESTGDTGLGPQAGQGNGISHVSFCYDEEDAPPPPPPTATPPSDEPTPTPPADEPPPVEPTPTPDVPSVPGQPSPVPSQEVHGVTGTPAPTLPPTDTLSGGSGDTESSAPAVLVILAILLAGGVLAIRVPGRMRH